MENELFEIRLSEKGKTSLLRTHFWVKFLYICTLISCVADLSSAFLSAVAYTKIPEYSATLKFRFILNIVFLLVYAVMLPLQAFFFYRFSKKATREIRFQNPEEFNNSFHWLTKHASWAAMLFLLNSIWMIINVLIIAKAL